MGIVGMKVLVFLIAIIAVCMAGRCHHWYMSNQLMCPQEEICIDPNFLCNGINNCGDNSDELYCDEAGSLYCHEDQFKCSNGDCHPRFIFCDGQSDCRDGSDEIFCDITSTNPKRKFCPSRWFRCQDDKRCIQENWKCDGNMDCFDGSDEIDCEVSSTRTFLATEAPQPRIPNTSAAKDKNIRWLLSRRKNDSSSNRWGHELHRIAIALYLADKHYFAPGNKVSEEISYELTIQLLNKLSGNNTIRSQELALYIQALLVTCTDPKDFFGHNLVTKLRRRVEASNYTNPFEIIALCNAGDTMTHKDIERVTSAFDSQHRPFWTDTQAIAALAMQCLSSSSNVRVDERMIKAMQDELKKRQFRNGTVGNPKTTALVIQALLRNESYKEYFDLSGAITVLLEKQDRSGSWGSVRNSNYVLPALSFKSFLNISSKHCVKLNESEEDALLKLQDSRDGTFVVVYSIWVGNDVDLGRTWRVRMKASRNSTFYDVIETVRKLDTRHNVTYNVIDNKPYVSALYGKEDDPELGVYWFTYVRSLKLPEAPKLMEASPVDVKVDPDQELILWYKPGRWNGGSTQGED